MSDPYANPEQLAEDQVKIDAAIQAVNSATQSVRDAATQLGKDVGKGAGGDVGALENVGADTEVLKEASKTLSQAKQDLAEAQATLAIDETTGAAAETALSNAQEAEAVALALGQTPTPHMNPIQEVVTGNIKMVNDMVAAAKSALPNKPTSTAIVKVPQKVGVITGAMPLMTGAGGAAVGFAMLGPVGALVGGAIGAAVGMAAKSKMTTAKAP